jgi:hypothetical protein
MIDLRVMEIRDHITPIIRKSNASNILVKDKVVPVLNYLALRHEGAWGNGCIDPYFLNLGTSWR